MLASAFKECQAPEPEFVSKGGLSFSIAGVIKRKAERVAGCDERAAVDAMQLVQVSKVSARLVNPDLHRVAAMDVVFRLPIGLNGGGIDVRFRCQEKPDG